MAKNPAKRKVRNAYAISTVSVSLVLFLLGSVGYLIMNARKATTAIRENITVSVLLDDDITPEQRNRIKTDLSAKESVKKITYISKEKAAADFKNHIGKDFELFLGQNPLPASYEVTLHDAFATNEYIAGLEKEAAKWNGVEEVLYQSGIIDQISSNIYRFNIILFSFGIALLFVSLILISNTIRMAVFSKRFIINTMKLVGATHGFIRRPFILSGLKQGFWASTIASVLIVGLIAGLKRSLPEVEFIISDWPQLALLFGGVYIIGMLVCFIFTFAAIQKYIRLSTDSLHVF